MQTSLIDQGWAWVSARKLDTVNSGFELPYLRAKELLSQAIELEEEQILFFIFFGIPVKQGHGFEGIRATFRRLGVHSQKSEE